MKLGELFDKGEFVVTGEVGPVKGAIPRDENFCSVLGQRSETFEMMGRFIKKHKFKFQGVHIMPLG